jgi:hypothetical protein
LLAVLLLLLVAAAALLWRRAYRRRRDRARVLAEVDALAAHRAGDAQALAAGLHQLLRRVARMDDPAAAHARGEAWREALARVAIDTDTLERLLALEPAIYRPQPYDTSEMLEAVRRWLRAALAHRPRTRRA